jgi:hypothetical protein
MKMVRKLGLTEIPDFLKLNVEPNLHEEPKRMRHPVAWLCLLIALASPLASQAKAAYGLALWLSEIGHNVLESPQEEEDEAYDGHDLLALTASAHVGIDGSSQGLTPAFDLPPPSPNSFLAAFDVGLVLRPHGRVYWPPPTLSRRLASLQTFLL